jgi:hypothetical protein
MACSEDVSDLILNAYPPGERDRALAFLCGVFGFPSPPDNLAPAVLDWKCFAAHPFDPDSRGYFMLRRDEPASHGILVPGRLLLPGGSACRTAVVIDWASSRTAAGAGILLYRALEKKTDILFGIGGSEDSRRVLPRMGFQAAAPLGIFRAPVRPWRQTGRGWRHWARCGRDWARRLTTPRAAVPAGWTWRRVSSFSGLPALPLPHPDAGSAVFERDALFLDYLLACPAATMSGWLFEKDGRPVGWAVLARRERICRVADAWVDEPELWAGLHTAVLGAAATDPEVATVEAAALPAPRRRALVSAGFFLLHDLPVFLRDPAGRLAGQDPALSLAENDAFYLG